MSTDRMKDVRFIQREDSSAGEYLITGFNADGQRTLVSSARIVAPIVAGHQLRLLVPSKHKNIVQVTRDRVKSIMPLSDGEFMITMQTGAKLHMIRAPKREKPELQAQETFNTIEHKGHTFIEKFQNLFKRKS